MLISLHALRLTGIACVTTLAIATGAATSGIAAPGRLDQRAITGGIDAMAAIQVSEKGKCIYRCRIVREECVQDAINQSRNEDGCWDAFQGCRSGCGGGDVADEPELPPHGGGQDVVADNVVIDAAAIPLGKWTEGIAFDGRWLWVSESGQRTVAQVDLDRGRLVKRFKVGRLPVGMVSTNAGDVFSLVHTDQLIWRHTNSGRDGRLTKLNECPEGITSDGDTLWVLTLPNCSSESSRIVRVDPNNGRTAQTNVLPEWGQALVAYGNQIWVGHARGPGISIVDKSSLNVSGIETHGVSFWSIASNSSYVYGGGRESENNNSGIVVMFDPRQQTDLARALVSERVAEIVADETHVVAVGEKGTIWVFAADDLALQRTITLASGPFDPRDVIIKDDQLLISRTNYNGENGAVMVLSNWRPEAISGGGGAGGGGGNASPSFNCAQAQNATEQTICSDAGLASLDRDLDGEYSLALSNIRSPAVGGTAADVSALRREQRNWIRQRDNCGTNARCIANSYAARLRILKEINVPE